MCLLLLLLLYTIPAAIGTRPTVHHGGLCGRDGITMTHFTTTTNTATTALTTTMGRSVDGNSTATTRTISNGWTTLTTGSSRISILVMADLILIRHTPTTKYSGMSTSLFT